MDAIILSCLTNQALARNRLSAYPFPSGPASDFLSGTSVSRNEQIIIFSFLFFDDCSSASANTAELTSTVRQLTIT